MWHIIFCLNNNFPVLIDFTKFNVTFIEIIEIFVNMIIGIGII